MPYIGNTAADRFVASKTASVFSGDGSTTAFTLDHSVGSDEDILVSVDGVIQEPSVAYSVSGTTLTFTAAPSSNAGNNIFVYYLFRTVGTVSHPSSNALEATSGTFTGDLTVDTATLHVDSTNNRVGVGTASPDYNLQIEDDSTSVNLSLRSSTASNSRIYFGDSDSATIGAIIYRNGNDTMAFETNGSEAMRISGGNVGIGTTSPASNLEVESSGDTTLRITAGGTSNDSKIDFVHGTTVDGGITFDHNGSYTSEVMSFRAGNNTPHVYLKGDGQLLVGKSAATLTTNGTMFSSSGSQFSRTSNTVVDVNRNGTDGNAMAFYKAGSNVGTIRVLTSSTQYNTSSDHRLKENLSDMTGAIDRVKQLSPKRFNFIADDTDTLVDGFLAHEAQTVVPEAVGGTHNEVDEDGNPVYQGIDQSKLVPLLTGALKEAIEKIEALETANTALEARITALENS